MRRIKKRLLSLGLWETDDSQNLRLEKKKWNRKSETKNTKWEGNKKENEEKSNNLWDSENKRLNRWSGQKHAESVEREPVVTEQNQVMARTETGSKWLMDQTVTENWIKERTRKWEEVWNVLSQNQFQC